MPDVSVSASRTPVPLEQIGSAVTVITSEEIERKQVRYISDILRSVPGVAISRSGPQGSFTQARIRGSEGNHTLVVIDGIEMNDQPTGSEYDLGTLLAADIERIEVLRGPQSALYGSDAVGGVINIITKRGRGPVKTSVSLEGGSFDTHQESASIRGGTDTYDFSFGATHFSTSGVSMAPNGREDDSSRNHTYNAKLGVRPIEDLSIDFFGRYVSANIESDPQPAVAGVIRTVDGEEDNDIIQKAGRVQAKYTMLDGAWDHILGAGYYERRSDSRTNNVGSFWADGDKTKLDYQTNYKFDTPSFAGAAHTLTFLMDNEVEHHTTQTAKRELESQGYTGEYRLGLFDRVFLSASGRMDLNEMFDDAKTYRATAAYLHKETDTRAHASLGTGVKNPTLTELYGFSATFRGNRNLRPESNEAWDLGVEQKFLDDRASLDVTYFNNKIENLISGSGNTAVNLPGVTEIFGYEFTGRVDLTEDLQFNGQYTFTSSQDPNGAELVRRARHIASASLGYSFLDKRAKLDLGVDYNGKQRDTEFSNFFDDSRRITLNSFTLVRVSGSYEFATGFEVFGRVENALDKQYQEVLDSAEPGIGAYLGVRATF